MVKSKQVVNRRWWLYLTTGGVLLTVIVVLVAWEMRSSELQARLFSGFARQMQYQVLPGPSSSIRFPAAGPLDRRRGYSRLPRFLKRLEAKGYRIEAQARFSPQLSKWTDWHLFPPYREKRQTGLLISDREGRTLFTALYPRQLYSTFDAIPPLIVKTLLAIENKELLDPRFPKRNPAVEWDRLFKAALEYPFWTFGRDGRGPGGSTLATQLEKARHSPYGLTESPGEKLRQIASATMRAYRDGAETSDAQRRIILDYLNSLPLAAVPKYGEVVGLAAGLAVWYGADFNHINRTVRAIDGKSRDRDQALAYKQVLSLLLAQRRPTELLVRNPEKLLSLTDRYATVLMRQRVISPDFREAVLDASLNLQGEAKNTAPSPRDRKIANVVRTHLARLLGVPSFYDLDRLDLSVDSSLDRVSQRAITKMLKALHDPAKLKQWGLTAGRMLGSADPAPVRYSFSLYEKGDGVNWLRVQTDNMEGPFDLNEGLKLDLGSTAKLRTLVTYLQIIADLHQQYIGYAPHALRKIEVGRGDHLTAWVIDQLARKPAMMLSDLLTAAMQRRYSANPWERFYTGGGLHKFRNFSVADNKRTLSVRDAFRRSVNLVFIRMMRDIVRYYQYRQPEYAAGILDDPNHWLRRPYLYQFAQQEGRRYLSRFYPKYHGREPAEIERLLMESVKLTPIRLATLLRSLYPADPSEVFRQKMREYLPAAKLSPRAVERLYNNYGVERYDLQERGYIARVHPLELWLAAYLRRHPDATFREVLSASTQARVEAYAWLFKTRSKRKQDVRIKNMLERDVFVQIHHAWRELGYPFNALVPSYATAIGASADRPAALGELIGIIGNDGVSYPTRRIKRLYFAEDTPYETVLTAAPSKGERVMPREVAAVVRDALLETVKSGTARRAYAAFAQPDNEPLPIGGKTGTGDHRVKVYGKGRRLIEERVVNRTATFVFLIGERFYGVVTAHVPGAEAANYRFTSALAVELFRILAPELMAVIDHEGGNLVAVKHQKLR